MPATLVNVAFSKMGRRSHTGDVDVHIAQSAQTENIATPTTSKQTTATARRLDMARITPVAGDVYAAAGASPTATAGDWLIIAGTTLTLAVEEGDKIAVIDR